MEAHLLSSSTVIVCSDAKSEENLVISPAHTQQDLPGSPSRGRLKPVLITRIGTKGCHEFAVAHAIFSDEQGQSQKPMQLSLNQ